MGEKMTLEQVRDRLRSWYGGSEACLDARNVELLGSMIDAIDAHLTQPAQAVDVGAIRCIARLLRALSPDGEEWRSSNPNNATVLDVRKLADKLTAALTNANGAEGVGS